MPNFMTLEGTGPGAPETPVPVLMTGAGQDESELIGDQDRSFDGTLWVTARGYKRNWSMETGPLLPDEEAMWRDYIQTHPRMYLRGDMVAGQTAGPGGLALTVFVTITSSEYLSDGTVDGFFRLMKLKLREY